MFTLKEPSKKGKERKGKLNERLIHEVKISYKHVDLLWSLNDHLCWLFELQITTSHSIMGVDSGSWSTPAPNLLNINVTGYCQLTRF